MTRTALIDGDIIVYKAAFVSQTVSPFDPKKKVVKIDSAKMRREIDSYINDAADAVKADNVLVCLTDRGNEFRKKLWPEYKGTRKQPKPALFNDALDYIQTEWPTKIEAQLEADDVMGIMGSAPPTNDVVVSEDKDMRSVPCLLYNPGKPKNGIETINRVAANSFWMQQTVTGDPTDGYKGAVGVGPKSEFVSRLKMLSDERALWYCVLEAYRSVGQTHEDAVLNARLARILRYGEWARGKGPQLWKPPSAHVE